MQSALANLSEEHRTILVLREIDGCCYESIAELLDLPLGTVRSRLFRARIEMREQLKNILPSGRDEVKAPRRAASPANLDRAATHEAGPQAAPKQ